MNLRVQYRLLSDLSLCPANEATYWRRKLQGGKVKKKYAGRGSTAISHSLTLSDAMLGIVRQDLLTGSWTVVRGLSSPLGPNYRRASLPFPLSVTCDTDCSQGYIESRNLPGWKRQPTLVIWNGEALTESWRRMNKGTFLYSAKQNRVFIWGRWESLVSRSIPGSVENIQNKPPSCSFSEPVCRLTYTDGVTELYFLLLWDAKKEACWPPAT